MRAEQTDATTPIPPSCAARRMRGLAALLILALLAGCVASPAGTVEPADADAAALPEPTLIEWSGHVIASEIEGPTHARPSEDVMWPLMQEGILFSVDEVPQQMDVTLSWDGPGAFMIMLHSHKAHGTNAYVEHITALDEENPKCLRVPTEDLTAGVWQVMVHSEGAQQTDFTLGIAMTGGAGHIVEDDRHGHWLQDGGFEVEEHEIWPCVQSDA